jgi:hypothetical protein
VRALAVEQDDGLVVGIDRRDDAAHGVAHGHSVFLRL